MPCAILLCSGGLLKAYTLLGLLTFHVLHRLCQKPAGRTAAAGFRCGEVSSKGSQAKHPVEESPGSMMTRWRLTAAGGNPRESATENIPPALAAPQLRRGKGEKVR